MSLVSETLADYRAEFADAASGPVIIRRYGGTGAARGVVKAAQVAAKVYSYRPQDVVGAVKLGDRRVIALNDPSAAVPAGMVPLSDMLPLTDADRIVIDGAEASIEGVDANTRRVAGTLIALELQVRG